MADNKGVLVVAEREDGAISSITMELLGAGRNLADALGEELSAVLLGSGLGDQPKELIAYGASKVYAVDGPLLAAYQSDAYVAAAEKVCAQAQPRIILFGQTSTGQDFAPRLAFRLETGLATGCVGLDIDAAKKLQALRPAYGGMARAVVAFADVVPQMASLRVKAFEPASRDDSRSGEVISVPLGMAESDVKTRYIERVKGMTDGVRLEDAPVVVCGGRGIGGPEPFQKELKELADMLKGAVGATKSPADAGWVPASLQIGLSSKFVSPDLYIGIGVSGAVQHMAGCTGAKVIVAINRDRAADIFRYARYGIVADWKEALPAFTQRLKEIRGT